jgi:hypothetical protein
VQEAHVALPARQMAGNPYRPSRNVPSVKSWEKRLYSRGSKHCSRPRKGSCRLIRSAFTAHDGTIPQAPCRARGSMINKGFAHHETSDIARR